MMQHPTTRQYQWKRFTVKGIPEKCQKSTCFISHYMLNIIPRGSPCGRDMLVPFVHTTDMVHIQGIGYSLNFVLQPKSGFRIQLLMFQMPDDMQQLSEHAGVNNQLEDNKPTVNSKFSKQGSYSPNGCLLTKYEIKDGEYLSSVKEGYTRILGDQKRVYDNVQPAMIFNTVKINHPNVTILLDCHLTAINQRTKPKMFGINRIVPSKTTWKYPTVVSNGVYQGFKQDDQIPDHKVYFIVMATPIFGPVVDPLQDMHGVDVTDAPEDQDNDTIPPIF